MHSCNQKSHILSLYEVSCLSGNNILINYNKALTIKTSIFIPFRVNVPDNSNLNNSVIVCSMIPFFSSGDAYGTMKNSYQCKPHTIHL